jgi:hypothetical protein
MHYFLVNGTNFTVTEAVCDKISEVLSVQYKAKVETITDPWLDSQNSDSEAKELRVKLTHMDVKPQEKLSLILDWRERLMKEVVVPAMGEGNIVLYHGGFLQDDLFIDKTQIPFDLVLRENLEMLQSIGGIAYPAGSVVVQSTLNKLEEITLFEEKARKLGESMSRFKRLRHTVRTSNEDLQMLLNA